jgi:hypothetical protein
LSLVFIIFRILILVFKQKIENLLAPTYPELLDLFLTFLGPGQAAEVGRFFEHFILTNMTTFLDKLNIYFNKQPTQVHMVSPYHVSDNF